MNLHWSGAPRGTGRPRASILRAVQEIGLDIALTPAELSADVRRSPMALRAAWAAYDRHWARFCGAQLDPQFWRLDHPGQWIGRPVVADGAPVVVIGTGPSLRVHLDALRRCRAQVHLFTSPRGADALMAAGLTPDLVLIEHQTPLDAHFSVQALTHGENRWRSEVPVVATDTRTPAALLHGVPPDRLLVVDPMPTWGMWPATAAAIALDSGASAVGLLGVDLGSPEAIDPRQRPLVDLLSLLPLDAKATCLDLGNGAGKPGWPRGSFADVLPGRARGAIEPVRTTWASAAERQEAARTGWVRTAAITACAAGALALAARVRDGDHSDGTLADLVRHMDSLLACGADLQARIDVQDSLGCGLLPRFWRTPPDRSLGPLLWRPLALAAHELVHQHHALGVRLEGAAAPGAGAFDVAGATGLGVRP